MVATATRRRSHTDLVDSAAISADASVVVSGGSDNTVRVWALDWDLDLGEPTDWDEGAPSPGVARILADRDAIVRVLRHHGALFAYLDHKPLRHSAMPWTDRTIAVWFDPRLPLPDMALVKAQVGSAVELIEVLNKAPFEYGGHIVSTAQLLFDNDRPARVGWVADMRWVMLDNRTITVKGTPRSHAVNFLSAPQAPPARLADMLKFVRARRQAVLDDIEQLHRFQPTQSEALTLLRNEFFAAVIGCARTAHLVAADNDWEVPAGRDVFVALVDHGVTNASVAESFIAAQSALDLMIPNATPQQVLETCFDPIYTKAIEQFLDDVKDQAPGWLHRFWPWRRR